MSVLRDLWAFSFLRLAGSESVLDFPFLACCHIREGPPSFCSLFALSQCRISRPFLPAPRCCTAATTGPQAKMLNYSFVPESTVPGKDVNSAKNPPPFPPPTTVFGVFLSAANTGKHKGDNALISPGKVYFTLGSTLERDKGDLEHVPTCSQESNWETTGLRTCEKVRVEQLEENSNTEEKRILRDLKDSFNCNGKGINLL